ncbi:toxin [Leptospira levettii]|uniref:toxin n=1 Tax=Leptospira levettii TaxID=2023178 RepID=UPI00223CB249|nr:toxin [Leptospira levettii]MCW7474814.1 toxin [Leptospira levettii]
MEYPNSEKYPNQLILMVNIDDYAWVVPVIKTKNSFFLKSASPSRKQTKHYLKKENLHETETD